MSNDVYPFRFKAFRSDTPILDCPRCGRRHAIVGEWRDETQTHYVPDLCFDCRHQHISRCLDCGTPKQEGALSEGRCDDCNRKRNYGECERCRKPTPRRYLVGGRCSNCQMDVRRSQLGVCRGCGQLLLKSDLSYGRCNACEKRGKEFDPSRLCVECGQPFITVDHVDWFKAKGLDVAKSHSAIKKQCPPTTSATRPIQRSHQGPARSTSRSARRTPTSASSSQPKQGFWERLRTWFRNI